MEAIWRQRRRLPPAGATHDFARKALGGAPMFSNSSVLIVDRCSESREVLRMALARRGVRVLESSGAADALALVRLHRPDVTILDLDATGADRPTAADFAEIAEFDGGTLIVLGSAREYQSAQCGEYVPKPYHYGPLILKIEELLRERQYRAAA
jgi:CheY-like chemotaxis protein